jgi:hypothetical protein
MGTKSFDEYRDRPFDSIFGSEYCYELNGLDRIAAHISSLRKVLVITYESNLAAGLAAAGSAYHVVLNFTLPTFLFFATDRAYAINERYY